VGALKFGGLVCNGNNWHWLGMQVCSTTMVQTWMVMGVVALLGLIAAGMARRDSLGGLQLAMESVLEFIGGFASARGILAAYKSRRLLFEFLITLFFFILVANMFDLIPPFMAPTNTLSTTAALAILVFLYQHVAGLIRHKGRYGRKFLHVPGVMGYFFLIFTAIEELSKPITLAFRLFGNIFAGELLIEILLSLVHGSAFYFGGFIVHVAALLFAMFVGVVQAFIFMILTFSYVDHVVPEEQTGIAQGEGLVH
jgi:F-type H+-transporting ATPase subunit a